MTTESLMDGTPFAKVSFLASHAAQISGKGIPFDMDNPDVAMFLATHTNLKVRQGALWLDWAMLGEEFSTECPFYKANREDLYLKVCRVIDKKPNADKPTRKKSWEVPVFKDATKDLDLTEMPSGLTPVEKVKWVYDNLGVIRHKDVLCARQTVRKNILPDDLEQFRVKALSLPMYAKKSIYESLGRSIKALDKITVNMEKPDTFCECRDKLWTELQSKAPLAAQAPFNEYTFALLTVFGANVCTDYVEFHYDNDGTDLGSESYTIEDDYDLIGAMLNNAVGSQEVNFYFPRLEFAPVARMFNKPVRDYGFLFKIKFRESYKRFTDRKLANFLVENWKSNATDEVKEFLNNPSNFHPYHIYQASKTEPLQLNLNAVAISLYEHTGKLLSPLTLRYAIEKKKLPTLEKGIEICSSNI